MHLIKLIKKEYFYIALFVLAFLFTRLPGIYGDNINPDGANWHWRSEQFVVGLKHLQLERTYQHYQPGVTLMWLVGPIVELVRQFNNDIPYNKDTFLVFDYVARIALIFVQLGLSIIGIYLLAKIVGFKRAWLVFVLFSLEPFFLANSRMLHLDILLTLLLTIGLILSYLYIRNNDWRYGSLSGMFLGLATLTKSVAVGGILFAVGFTLLQKILNNDIKSGVKQGFVVLLSSVVAIGLFLPALWVNAQEVLFLIYDGIERVGIRRGHGQVVFGEEVRDAGVSFYPLVFLLKSSPLFLLLAFIGVLKTKWSSLKLNLREIPLSTYLTIFFLGYLIVMTISSKKIDRYILPIYPYASLLIVLSLNWIKGLKSRIGMCVLFGAFVLYPIINLYPHYFTYTNPFFGSPKYVHENILAQKPFGIGIPALKREILDKYGYYPKLGFIDFKPMEAIYMASRVFDVNVDGPGNYQLMILGVNEEIPQKVLDSPNKFNLDHTVEINELEYWKIYVKETPVE